MDELAELFFTLLLFVDYQQVEVAPDQMALYGRVDKVTAIPKSASCQIAFMAN
jgi:hypothetical protein